MEIPHFLLCMGIKFQISAKLRENSASLPVFGCVSGEGCSNNALQTSSAEEVEESGSQHGVSGRGQ